MSLPPSKIVVRNLYKVFGHHSHQALEKLQQGWDKTRLNNELGAVVGVNDVSFEVNEGEIFVLMGLSGSGKSTLIRLINRLISPTAGSVHIDGQDVLQMKKDELIELRRREMSMVFQSFALMPNRNVLQNAAFGLEVAGVGREEREKRANEVLEQVGLKGFSNKKIDELSGGMRQRVGLARALAVNPSLIIMDEAFSALDPLIRREMQDILLDLQREHRRTVLFVSHDIEEALRIGNRIAIMEGGRMVQVGTPEELIAAPANDYVRNFFSSIDTSRFLTAKQLADTDTSVFTVDQLRQSPGEVLTQLSSTDSHHAFLVDEAHHFAGSISRAQLGNLVSMSDEKAIDDISSTITSLADTKISPLPHNLPIEDVITRLRATNSSLPVIDETGRYYGMVSPLNVLTRLGESAQ